MGDVAVPQSTVAGQPALQWVSKRTGSPCFLDSANFFIIFKPNSPIFLFISTSSSAILCAASNATTGRWPSGTSANSFCMRSSDQRKLIAVGRVSIKVSYASFKLWLDASVLNATAIP